MDRGSPSTGALHCSRRGQREGKMPPGPSVWATFGELSSFVGGAMKVLGLGDAFPPEGPAAKPSDSLPKRKYEYIG